MYKVRVIRVEETIAGSIGVLLIDGYVFCMTLEPDDKDAKRSQIPPGVYQCKRRVMQDGVEVKYPNTFEIKVPGHTDVLIHWGNVEEDTLMCVILGQYTGYLEGSRAVLNSKNTFDKFMKELEDFDLFEIEFINLY